jgi:hypothetical protein
MSHFQTRQPVPGSVPDPRPRPFQRFVTRSLVAIGALSVLAACATSPQASHPASRRRTTAAPGAVTPSNATPGPATPVTAPTPPCGGAATIPAAVKASPVAGLNVTADEYNVANITIAASDPSWASFFDGPVPAFYNDFQGGHGLVHCDAGQWTVTDAGTAMVGCPGSAGLTPSAAVLAEVGFGCP